MGALIQLAVTALLLFGAYFTGTYLERKHFADIRRREKEYLKHPYMTIPRVPDEFQVARSGLVSGQVVVSLDYFKRFVAGLRGLIGGRIRTYEPLLDRARREALLRMREQAIAKGYDMVINVRIETSRLASGGANRRGTAGVEIFAFGTAIKAA